MIILSGRSLPVIHSVQFTRFLIVHHFKVCLKFKDVSNLFEQIAETLHLGKSSNFLNSQTSRFHPRCSFSNVLCSRMDAVDVLKIE